MSRFASDDQKAQSVSLLTGTETGIALDISNLLLVREQTLTRSDWMVAGIVLQDFDGVLGGTITELAGRAGVSAPTVTRFCRKLGFKTFQDFKLSLARGLSGTAQAFPAADRSVAAAERARAIALGLQRTLAHAFTRLDYDALVQAARLIAHAERLLIVGCGGASANLALEAEARFCRLGFLTSAVTDRRSLTGWGGGFPASATVLVFALSGDEIPVRHALEVAANSVVITRAESAIARSAQLAVAVDGGEAGADAGGEFAFYAVLDALAQLVGERGAAGSERFPM